MLFRLNQTLRRLVHWSTHAHATHHHRILHHPRLVEVLLLCSRVGLLNLLLRNASLLVPDVIKVDLLVLEMSKCIGLRSIHRHLIKLLLHELSVFSLLELLLHHIRIHDRSILLASVAFSHLTCLCVSHNHSLHHISHRVLVDSSLSSIWLASAACHSFLKHFIYSVVTWISYLKIYLNLLW